MSKLNGRAKGHTYERTVAQWWRDLGFGCTTSRYTSREMDDQCVDLMGTEPFQCQLKAVEKLPKSYHAILDEMPKNSSYNLLFHKKNRQGSIVAMELDTFKELLQMLIAAGVIKVGCTGDAINFFEEAGIELQ